MRNRLFLLLVLLASNFAYADMLDFEHAHFQALNARAVIRDAKTRVKVSRDIESVGGSNIREELWPDGILRYTFFSLHGYECSHNTVIMTCEDGEKQLYRLVRSQRDVQFVRISGGPI